MDIYLDNAASTRMHPSVAEAMAATSRETFANASSIHRRGRQASSLVERSRETVARLIGAEVREIVFTSGATESDNLAIMGVARAQRGRGNHMITTTIEHPAVAIPCAELQREGFEITQLPVDGDGLVDIERLRASIRKETILLSVIMANNETGVVQAIREIGDIARVRNVLFHTDAVQALGKMVVDVRNLSVDLLSMSGHKIHGPKGVGALYVRQGTRIDPLLHGGGHEFGRRPGTQNVAGIVGFAAAMTFVHDRREAHTAHMAGLRDKLQAGIVERIPNVRVNSAAPTRLPNILNVSFEAVDGEAVVLSLDAEGICVSSGSACASGSMEPSPVLKAMGVPPRAIKGSVRFSLSYETTAAEIDHVLEVLPRVVQRLRDLSPLKGGNGL